MPWHVNGKHADYHADYPLASIFTLQIGIARYVLLICTESTRARDASGTVMVMTVPLFEMLELGTLKLTVTTTWPHIIAHASPGRTYALAQEGRIHIHMVHLCQAQNTAQHAHQLRGWIHFIEHIPCV